MLSGDSARNNSHGRTPATGDDGAVTKEPAIISFDGDAAARSAEEIVGEDLLMATEYTPQRFQVLYRSDRLVDA